MLPAQSPGAFSINNQLITLNLRTLYSLRRSAEYRERSSNTFKQILGQQQDSNL